MAAPIISLTTDFGSSSHYVAQMKGVILSLIPGCAVVDVSHGIAMGDVLAAAYVLELAVPAFPADSVHVVVVDPGVGTDRRALAVRFAGRTIVGPDNGCLTAFLDAATAVYEITNEELYLPEVSATFHGRDIFAPVAAFLAGGGELSATGPVFDGDPVRVPDLWAEGDEGVILHVDRFGNLITNFAASVLDEGVRLSGPGVLLSKHVRTFAEADGADPFLFGGSGGRLEVAVNGGNAETHLGWHRGTTVMLERER